MPSLLNITFHYHIYHQQFTTGNGWADTSVGSTRKSRTPRYDCGLLTKVTFPGSIQWKVRPDISGKHWEIPFSAGSVDSSWKCRAGQVASCPIKLPTHLVAMIKEKLMAATVALLIYYQRCQFHILPNFWRDISPAEVPLAQLKTFVSRLLPK